MNEVLADLRKRKIEQKKRLLKSLRARRANITGGPVDYVERTARESISHCDEMIQSYK